MFESGKSLLFFPNGMQIFESFHCFFCLPLATGNWNSSKLPKCAEYLIYRTSEMHLNITSNFNFPTRRLDARVQCAPST